ncbi:MAG: hypothetical protein U5K76_14980 [Woeseiaceae bacterium]|nr:hypothetical protein [Woeseiaceae bacterium]
MRAALAIGVIVQRIPGLEIVRQYDDIDLLFTDIVMPGEINGRELADAACAIRPGLKVLYTCGYAAYRHRLSLDYRRSAE